MDGGAGCRGAAGARSCWAGGGAGCGCAGRGGGGACLGGGGGGFGGGSGRSPAVADAAVRPKTAESRQTRTLRRGLTGGIERSTPQTAHNATESEPSNHGFVSTEARQRGSLLASVSTRGTSLGKPSGAVRRPSASGRLPQRHAGFEHLRRSRFQASVVPPVAPPCERARASGTLVGANERPHQRSDWSTPRAHRAIRRRSVRRRRGAGGA
jgi:hypothetical protein